MNPGRTVIVIRSLVAGGLAKRDGRLLPGDRLMFVNGTDLSHASLAQAVRVLKSTALGTVRIGVTKPLSVNFSIHFTISTIHKIGSHNYNLELYRINLESKILYAYEVSGLGLCRMSGIFNLREFNVNHCVICSSMFVNYR